MGLASWIATYWPGALAWKVLGLAAELRRQNATASKELPIEDFIPPQPAKSFRVVLELKRSEKRLDTVLLAALKAQDENLDLRQISRVQFKDLFKNKRIQIKGQNAIPTSGLAKGTTYVDILLAKKAAAPKKKATE